MSPGRDYGIEGLGYTAIELSRLGVYIAAVLQLVQQPGRDGPGRGKETVVLADGDGDCRYEGLEEGGVGMPVEW